MREGGEEKREETKNRTDHLPGSFFQSSKGFDVLDVSGRVVLSGTAVSAGGAKGSGFARSGLFPAAEAAVGAACAALPRTASGACEKALSSQ